MVVAARMRTRVGPGEVGARESEDLPVVPGTPCPVAVASRIGRDTGVLRTGPGRVFAGGGRWCYRWGARGAGLCEAVRRERECAAGVSVWAGAGTDAPDLHLRRERASRRADRSLLSLVAKLPETCHPMDVVRTAISYLGAEDDNSAQADRAKALRMFAVLPTIVAAVAAVSIPSRRIPTSATPRISCTCVTEPSPRRNWCTRSRSRLILYAEHSSMPPHSPPAWSPRRCRISTAPSPPPSARSRGPLHGGANEAVMRHMIEIGDPHWPGSGCATGRPGRRR